MTSGGMTAIPLIKGGMTASLVLFFEYFGLPKEPFFILTLLMAIDFFTGVAKAYSVKEPITSERGWKGVIKKTLILTVLIAIALAIKGTGYNGGLPLSIIVSLLITAELFSIIQNVIVFRTGKNMTEFDATNFILQKLLDLLKAKLEK